ncbi:Holliday junction resolvase RuvX, partial [[Kitasatospora] papulosa]|uniref:Holliday junction resolvase RuvX n=1 Tax=[Kitasatospora] papulosa TaxID=1464011 RepID=UPI0036B2E65A
MSQMRRGRRLAIDVGDARIGVASCDPDGVLATPVETVPGRGLPAPPPRRGAHGVVIDRRGAGGRGGAPPRGGGGARARA